MKFTTGQSIIVGYLVALLTLGIVALLTYRSTRQYVASVAERRSITVRIERLGDYLSVVKDAENGQRGYLLFNRPEYLLPYTKAVADLEETFTRLRAVFAKEEAEIEELHRLTEAKMEELARTLALRALGTPEAEAEIENILSSHQGRTLMENIRGRVAQLQAKQKEHFDEVDHRVQAISSTTVTAISIMAPLAVAVAGGALAFSLRDLRERARAEESLSDQRVLLSAILNSMSEGVAAVNERGQVIMVTPAAEEIIGWHPAGRSREEWIQQVSLRESDRVTPVEPSRLPLVRALRGEVVKYQDLYVVCEGSSRGRYIAGTASPLIDEYGRARGGVVVMRDTTHSRSAEQRFQSLLESAPDALIIVNRQGEILLVNTQTERLFGYDRNYLVGQKVELLVPQSLRSAHPAQREAFFDSPRIRPMGSGLELYGERADGFQFPIEISLAPVESDGETLVCAAVRDVTERRRVMDQIRQLNDELEARVSARTSELANANEELMHRNQENEMFVYSVSHDLRSPLVNLQGFSQELENACERLRQLVDRPDAPVELKGALAEIVETDVTESIHFIRTSVSRLSGIIDALLRLSRAGRVVYQWQTVDVNVIVRRVLDAAHGTIQARNAEISVAELPSVWGDSTAIEQVFANLVHNALNYVSPDRPAAIELGVREQSNPTCRLHTYFVRDNGIGIPAEQQPKIFQAFQRLHPKLAPGEGMGLTLVQRIVERHGGKIWLESIAGRGSIFYFTLPMVAEQATTEGVVAPVMETTDE